MARLHPQGTLCWLELSTTDPAAAGRFYGRLFGWKTSHREMPTGGTYTFLRLEGEDVGAVYALGAADRGIDGTGWLPFVAVDDCEAAADRAGKLGGEVIAGPSAVPGAGTVAVLRDPGGATLALYEAVDHPGLADIGEAVGAAVWIELMTRDVPGMKRFYGALFDWKTRDTPMASGVYTEFRLGETSVAGMMAMPGGLEGAGASWLTYFRTDDLDRTVRAAEDAGAEVNVAPQAIEGVGRFAVLADPQGAVFALLEPLR